MKNQGSINLLSFYFRLAVEKNTIKRSFGVAILVGIILNLINNPHIFLDFSFYEINLLQVILTFIIPFLVSTHSSVLSNTNLKPGKTATIDALLKCKSCKKTNFHSQIGEQIEECPACKKKTRWVPFQLFAPILSNNEILKSLALFARFNPQPLFRLDSKGIILNSNLASDALFEFDTLAGKNLVRLFPELQRFNLNQIIKNEEVREILIAVNGKFYNLVLKGVSMLGNVHVYGNDISQVILNERKIKIQAKAINESIQYSLLIQKAMLPSKE